MPFGFAFPENHRAWIALAPIAEKDPRSARSLFTLGRLKPGVELSQARTELLAVTAKLANEYPATNEGWSALVRPAAEEFTPDDVRLVIWTMMGAVTLVLMIACANVANLMLARASMRQREFSVRAAIGAGRGRMIRQLLTECVLLGCCRRRSVWRSRISAPGCSTAPCRPTTSRTTFTGKSTRG